MTGAFRDSAQAAAEHALALDRRFAGLEADLAALRARGQMLRQRLHKEQRRFFWLPEIKGLLAGFALAAAGLVVLAIGEAVLLR